MPPDPQDTAPPLTVGKADPVGVEAGLMFLREEVRKSNKLMGLACILTLAAAAIMVAATHATSTPGS